MKRGWLPGVLTGVAVGVAALAFAKTMVGQGAATPVSGRVACVNVIYTINEYQQQKDLPEEFNGHRERVMAEDKQRKDRIDTLQAEIDRMDPNDPTLVQRMREMLALQIDYKNWRDLKQADTARELGVWSIRIYRDVVRAVEELAKRDGYDMVYYRGEFEQVSMDPDVIREQIRSLHLLYANPAIDLTQVVLDKLNAEYRAKPRQKMLLQVP